jgi:hypothetical protein
MTTDFVQVGDWRKETRISTTRQRSTSGALNGLCAHQAR